MAKGEAQGYLARLLAAKAISSWRSLSRHKRPPPATLVRSELGALSLQERAFLNELIFGTVRWLTLLEWLVDRRLQHRKRPSFEFKSFILVGTYQILFLCGIPDHAAINETVEAAKRGGFVRGAGLVNAILRRIAREKQAIIQEEMQDLPLHLRYAHPKWMVKRWLSNLGESATEALLKANNERPPLTLRVDLQKIGRDEYLRLLKTEGIEGRPGRLCPEAVIIDERIDPRLVPGHDKGLFYVQDEAFQLVSHLLEVRPGDRVLDACSGVGGKATHLVQLMKGEGELWAFETNRQRRRLLLENLERHVGDTRMRIVVPTNGDVLSSLSRQGMGGYFDKVLVDAPCSGLGVIRRHPDIKWNRRIEDIGYLSRHQLELLRGVIDALRPGGRLVYCTCTNEPEETVDVVERALREIRHLCLVPPRDLSLTIGEIPKELISSNRFVTGHPPDTDGFFAAIFTL